VTSDSGQSPNITPGLPQASEERGAKRVQHKHIGENIYAIGNPKGLSNTISEGIVSGLRSLEGEDVIQHTAPISPGSSGEALVDSSGALLGMNSWQVTDGQNLNFAISSKHLLAALTSARQATTAVGFPPDARAENETETPTNSSSIPQHVLTGRRHQFVPVPQ
jgi:S1-C subfamily serine protease